jgi:2,3-dihydroxybenzoate decarboxylase
MAAGLSSGIAMHFKILFPSWGAGTLRQGALWSLKFVGRYTNICSANVVTYLDDPINAPFLENVVELDSSIYLHPRTPPPDQQRVYQDYNFLAGSLWGFTSEPSAHALHLIVSGMFDKYPILKIILEHCGDGLLFFLA